MKSFEKHLVQMIGSKSETFTSIDRANYMAGLQSKIMAYKIFLEKYPRTSNLSCLIQYVIPSDCFVCNKGQPDCEHLQQDPLYKEIKQMEAEI